MRSEQLPDYLKQSEAARLFPVFSTTAKEGRTTTIVLACLCKISEFGAHLLSSVGPRVGARANVETYTEVVCRILGGGSVAFRKRYALVSGQ